MKRLEGRAALYTRPRSSAAANRRQCLQAWPSVVLLASMLLLTALLPTARAQGAAGNSSASSLPGSIPPEAGPVPPAVLVVPATAPTGTPSGLTASPIEPAAAVQVPAASQPPANPVSLPPAAVTAASPPPAVLPSPSLALPAPAGLPVQGPPRPSTLVASGLPQPLSGAASAGAPAPSPSPKLVAPAPAPAPSGPSQQQLSLVLRLSGAELVPWSKDKGDLVLAALVSTLQAAGLGVTGSDLVVIATQGSAPTAAANRRLRDTASASNSVAAIPSLYSLGQAVEVQAVVAAPPGSQAAVQAALAAASAGGQLALALRNQGLAVSQVETLAVYPGIAGPTGNLTGVTATSADTSPAPAGASGAAPSSSSAAPSQALVIGICAGVGGAVVLTVGLFVYLRYRRGLGSSSDAAGGYRYDKSSAKQSPEPAPRRTASGNSIDLEGACTPRFRKPITPRRAALKGGSEGAAGGNFHLHAVSGAPPAPRAPDTQLLPGVHLMPRAPSGSAGSGVPYIPRPSPASTVGPRVPAAVSRAPIALQDMQDARRVAYLAQQAAEQAAMRDYLRSLPPQVVWEDEGAAPTAQNVARTHSRLARPAARPHASHGHSSGRFSFGPGSFSAGSSGAGSHTTGPSAPTSEAGYSASGASATSEIEPAGGTSAGRAQVLPSQRSLDARAGVGGGGGMLPETLKRAAAKVQPGSPRRSASRAKEPFATKDTDGGSGLSRLARGSSVPAEAMPTGF
ncbi:hypothetical protein ABPG77_002616 [Micractinium sp. CCAP 211/92]